MGVVERKVMEERKIKPRLYCRYIDDIFVEVRDHHHLEELKTAFEASSCLNFTFEVCDNESLPFLDTLVTREAEKYTTNVYTKETNVGICMNGSGECPDRYKRSVIDAYVRRSFTHCSTWKDVHIELNRVSQVLVNNNYSINDINRIIGKHMSRAFNESSKETPKRLPIKLYYRNYMSAGHKTDERIVTDIVNRGVIPTDKEDNIQLVIYYKNKKTSNLIMKNNLQQGRTDMSRVNVIYQYSCTIGDCKLRNNSYIGMTTTTLSRRCSAHLQSGTPKAHTLQMHGVPLTREMLVNNTTILDSSHDKKRLQIMEALHISEKKPTMNIQIGTTSIPLPSDVRV